MLNAAALFAHTSYTQYRYSITFLHTENYTQLGFTQVSFFVPLGQ